MPIESSKEVAFEGFQRLGGEYVRGEPRDLTPLTASGIKPLEQAQTDGPYDMRSASPEIVTVAEASPENPRHGGADLIELKDGTLLLAKMEVYRSRLPNQAGDD